MIEGESTFGNTFIYCDAEDCEQQFMHEGFDGYHDFQEACKEAKEYGWIILKEDGEYYHYCCEECKIKDDNQKENKMKVSVNELLVQIKMARQRINELVRLRDANSVKETTTYFGQDNKEVKKEPQYSAIEVDRKISKLERFVYKSDANVKASNAVTQIEVDQDIDELLEPIVPLDRPEE